MSILWFWDSLPPHPVEHVHSPQLAITPISLPLGPQKDSGHRQLIKMVWLDDFFVFGSQNFTQAAQKLQLEIYEILRPYHPPPRKGSEPRFSITGSIKHWGAGTAKDNNGEGGAWRWKPTYLGSPVLRAPSRCYIRIIHWAVYTTYIRCK